MNLREARRAEGQALVLFALFSFVLIGALALALDVGFLLSQRRQAQAAADASALAAARALVAGESRTEAEDAAWTYALDNGLASTGDGNMNVDVQGDHWTGRVTVDLTKNLPRFFLGAVYTGPWHVNAHAVAEVKDYAAGRYILIALEPPGIYVNGSMTLTAKDGSIISNDIINSSGESNTVVSDGFIDAAGTIKSNSSWYAPWGIRERRAPVQDPFANYAPPPKPTTPAITGKFRCKKNPYDDPTIYGEDCHFFPGYYRNADIRIWDPAKFEPGLYYFDNTSVEMISNSGARMDGDVDGVNFYFTGNPHSSIFKPNIGEAWLVAPGWSEDPDLLVVHGDYRDIVVWYDMCPGPDLDSSGNQNFFLGGVVYAPCSDIYLHGNPYGDTVKGMVVAGTITIKGTSDTGVSYLPYAPVGSYEVYLVE